MNILTYNCICKVVVAYSRNEVWFYFRPIRGVTAVVAGAGPAHALYFGSYEISKELMTKVTTHNHINYSKFVNGVRL